MWLSVGDERAEAQGQDVQGWLHIADGILNLVEAVLQVLFIELLLTKTISWPAYFTKIQ